MQPTAGGPNPNPNPNPSPNPNPNHNPNHNHNPNRWACGLVISQLLGDDAVQPEKVEIPHDLPTLRRNITEGLSNSVKHINQSDTAGKA